MHEPEQIQAAIKSIKDTPDDILVFYFKVISSKSTAKEKRLYAPLSDAIEKERRRRKTARSISTKPVQTTVTAEDCTD